MRTALATLAVALASTASLADTLQPLQAASSAVAATTLPSGHQARLYQRYCDKLREGPEAYAAFVRRMNVVTGFTYTEFAPRDATDPVRHQCRDTSGALASLER